MRIVFADKGSEGGPGGEKGKKNSIALDPERLSKVQPLPGIKFPEAKGGLSDSWADQINVQH